MAMFSDASQARKTRNEKELALFRVEKNGIPVYFVAAPLEMAEFSGTDAMSLKKGPDSDFESGNVPLLDYQTKLMSANSDAANMNLGIYNEALTIQTLAYNNTLCRSQVRVATKTYC